MRHSLGRVLVGLGIGSKEPGLIDDVTDGFDDDIGACDPEALLNFFDFFLRAPRHYHQLEVRKFPAKAFT